MKLLLIGPLTNKKDRDDIGGITILFELFLKELEERGIEFTVIDTLKANYKNGFIMYLIAIFRLIKEIPKHQHISLHATMNSFIFLGLIGTILSKFYSKTISIRKFAGSFYSELESAYFLKRRVMIYILKNSDLLFFETKYLLNKLHKYNSKIYWFPNVRSSKILKNKSKKFYKRFVYIGSINKEKGIDDLLAVIPKLSTDITIELYGPIKYKNEKYSKAYFQKKGISYRGVLATDRVIETLDKYDVLVLPSYREGYPGVIIEAFARGLPVIATELEGIKEMCRDRVDSILIEPKNQQQLLEAIESFNEDNYDFFHNNALNAFESFNSSTQTDLYLKRIQHYLKEEK